jgi:glycosyltransferase involved in cell wall biosynthesis
MSWRDAPDPQLWIVIPAYREASMIARVVATCRARFANVVVVDDGSRDGTDRAAHDAGAFVIRHPVNLGQGAALQTGLDFALSRRAALIATFDADGQHRIEDVEAMRDRLRAEDVDVVLGSRFLGHAENIPALKRIVLQLAVLFTRATTGLALTDAHNGLRLFTADAARRIRLTQNRMAHASEILAQIARERLRYVEHPITVLYTDYSRAKGQRLGNAVNILGELFLGRLER